ncbi:MAG: hypothetical protein JWP69_54 [Flaviaesturariibacter sp.]|nr:hypothetical protein [Flaviaesturariibacter sp.]
MKNMILAATALGAALAGSILYIRKKSVKRAPASEPALAAAIEHTDRPLHVMG